RPVWRDGERSAERGPIGGAGAEALAVWELPRPDLTRAHQTDVRRNAVSRIGIGAVDVIGNHHPVPQPHIGDLPTEVLVGGVGPDVVAEFNRAGGLPARTVIGDPAG